MTFLFHSFINDRSGKDKKRAYRIKYFFKKGEETIYKEVVFFLAQSATEEVNLSSEHIGYAWLSYEHARKKLTFNNAKELIENYKVLRETAADGATKLFDLIVVKALLPVFTLILGYIFGSQARGPRE